MIAYIILFSFGFLYFLFQFEFTKFYEATDSNNYLYIAQLITQGKLLYKDIFLDNFPLAAYLSVFYKTITFGNMQWFKLTGSIEAFATVILLYYYFEKKTKNMYIGLLAAFTFFTSFVFLYTSTNQLGLYNAVLFFLVGYILWDWKKYTLSGVFVALAVLTKGYMAPLALSLFLATLIQQRKYLLRFTVAGIITTGIVLLPTLLFALPEFIQQTIGYGLVRQPTQDKWFMVRYLISYDFVMVILLLSGVLLRKKSLPLWLMSIITPWFYLLYKDIYYMYFSMAALVAALNAGTFLIYFAKHKYANYIFIGFATLLCLSFIHTSIYILTGFENNKQIKDIDKLLTAIKKENPDSIYSYASTSNGISYMTGIPAFKNHIDITSNQFQNGLLDKKQLTEEVVNSRTVLILYASKQQDSLIIDSKIVDLETLFKKGCRVTYQHPLNVKNAVLNHFVVMKCYK